MKKYATLRSTKSSRRSLRWALLPAVGALLIASACGGSSDGDSSKASDDPSTAPSSTGAAADLVPDELKGGKVKIVTYNDYPPEMFVEGGKLVGFNPDLAVALAKDLGLTPDLVGSSFDAIIPGVQSGRYDFAIAGLNITPERLEVLDLISYVNNSTGYATAASKNLDIQSGDDLCGLTAAVLTGSSQATEVEDQSKKCTADGKEAVKVSTFNQASQANTAVISDRADVVVSQVTQLAYYSDKSGGQLELQPLTSGAGVQGLAVVKGSKLGPALQQGVKDLIENGEYARILEKWNVKTLALDTPEILTGEK